MLCEEFLPENPIILRAVNLCARSAHILPRPTILSHVDSCAARCRCAAALNRATFSRGVSLGGAGPMGIVVPLYGSLEVAVGPVWVNIVGSRAIMDDWIWRALRLQYGERAIRSSDYKRGQSNS